MTRQNNNNDDDDDDDNDDNDDNDDDNNADEPFKGTFLHSFLLLYCDMYLTFCNAAHLCI